MFAPTNLAELLAHHGSRDQRVAERVPDKWDSLKGQHSSKRDRSAAYCQRFVRCAPTTVIGFDPQTGRLDQRPNPDFRPRGGSSRVRPWSSVVVLTPHPKQLLVNRIVDNIHSPAAAVHKLGERRRPHDAGSCRQRTPPIRKSQDAENERLASPEANAVRNRRKRQIVDGLGSGRCVVASIVVERFGSFRQPEFRLKGSDIGGARCPCGLPGGDGIVGKHPLESGS